MDVLAKTSSVSESLQPEVGERRSGPDAHVKDGEASQTWLEPTSTGGVRIGRGSAWEPTLASIPEEAESGRQAEGERTSSVTGGLLSEHRGGAFGAARQLYRTQGIEEIWHRLRSMSERAASQAELEEFRHEVGDNLRSFQGAGKVVEFNGKQFLLKSELDWSRSTPAPGTAAGPSAEHSLSSGSSTRIEGVRAPRMTWKIFNPMVPGLFGTGGITVPTGPTTSRSHTHEVSRTSQLEVSLDAAVNAKVVSVPVSVGIAELDDRGYPTGRTEWIGGDASGANPIAVVVNVPVGLRSTGEEVPVPRSLPPALAERAATQATPGYHRGKPLTIHRAHGWGVIEQVLKLVGKLDTESQKHLRLFLSDENIESKLPEMAVSPQDAAVGKGWVTSDALSRGGNPVKRLLSSRVHKVQMRAVARKVTYLEHVGRARFEEVQSESAGRSASATVDRSVSAAYGAGPGYDLGAMSTGAGPHAESERGRSHTQTYERGDTGVSSRSYEGTVVRYRTVYDLEVRSPGQTPVIFSHALDAVHWAKSEDAERAGIHPGNEGASSGKDRTEVLSPVESAESVAPGAALALTDASELLSGVLRDSAKEIPGHRRWAWRDSTFIGDFGDSRLARGLSGRHERELGRGEEIDRALSPESLARRAPNLLTDQPLTVELTPEHGRAHDYHAAFRVEASLEGGLVDLGPADRATGPVKLSSNETGGRQQATHWSLGGGVLARVYTSLAGSSGILTSAHRVIYSRSRGTGYEEGTTLTTGGTRGVTLDEAGKVHPERVRRYEATVKLTVTGTHWSRHNELVRGVSFGRRGLDVPAEHRLKIVDESAEAQGREPGTVRVKVELELPESHPLPGYETKPVRSEELPDVPPHTIRDLSGTGSRESDGIRVVGMSGLGFVRDSIRSMLVKASGDPIFASRDGSNSALIDRTISIESARNDLRLFNRPTRVSGLQWKRRRADVVADVAVSHQLRDPVVLATVWEDHESGVTSTSTTSRDVSSAWKVTNSVEPVYLPISADSLTGAGTKIRGMGALLHELSYWVSTFSRRTGHATIVSNAQTLKGEPRKLYLVQANVETTVAVETRRHGNIDRWQLAELFPKLVPDRWRSAGEVRRAAERLELPEAARVLVTEAQLRDIEMQQAKADTERATASPHEANQKEPAGPTDLLPIPPGRELGGGRWTDGVIKPVDLIDAAAGKGRDLLAELHAQVTQRLGKDLADRLLPDSSLATEHDNLQEVQRYLSNVQGVLPDLANGGARTTLRLEDRLRGKTYELRLSAKALETPQPVGIRHGELRKTSKVTVTNTAARGIKRVLAEFTTMLVPNAMLQSAAAEEASHTPGQRHGAPYTNLGLGMAHVFEWLQQSRETTRGEANESESRETVRGALVERNLDVDFDVEIGRHGERIAATQVTARVTGTSIVEDHAAAPDGPVRGEVVKQEAEDATNAGMADWYEARDAEALPSDPAQFRITGFDGSRDDLVEGARRALVESGVEPDRSTLGLLRDMLTPGRIEKLGGLPSRDGVELELPAELGLRLKLYSTTRGPGRLTGASARITLGGGTEANRSTHVENGHDNAHAVFATPLIAAGVPQAPEHATYAKGREAFGTIAHWGVPMEALGASADGSEYSRSTKSGGGALPEGAEKPPAEALTSTWSYPTEFRFVAEPTSKLTRNRPAVVDVSFPTGYHVRRADRTHLIPGEVARRARELAQRDREWSVARDLVRAEEATARSKSRATGEDAPTGDRLEEFRASAAHAETKWWQAVEAYQAAWPSSEPDVRLIFGTDAKAVSPAQRVTVRRLATNIMREQLRGTDPKIRFRVKGTRGQSTVQLAPIADELAKALDRMQRHLPVQDRFDLEQFGGTRDVQFIDFPEPSVVEIWLDKSPDSPEPRGTLESSLSSGEPTAERDTGAGMSTGRPGEAAGHAETGDNGGDQRTRGAGLAPEEFRSESGEQGSATSVLRRVEVLSAHEPASQVRTDVVRASDIVFVPLTHQDTISGVFFPGPGEASVVQKAFERREEDHDAYATVLHHDEDGFSIWLTSGEQVTISEKSLFRLMTGGALPGGDLWRQRRRQIVLACLVADPSLSDSAGRTPLDQLRGMLRDDGYAGSVEGPVAHVSVREDGRFTRQVHDVPNPTTDAPRLANVPETAWGGDGRDAGNPTGPAAGIFDRKERTDVVGKLRGEAADPALRSVTLGPPRRDIAAVGNDIETAGHSASGEQPRPVPLRPTSTSVGGLGFGTGAVGGAEWDRIHAGMPGRPDGAETMHVYVAGKEGKFLVEDKMVGGRELAEYVRNSGALDRVDPGTSIFLALAGEHPNPAFRRELEQEGREFARELRRDRPFFQAGMSTTAMRVDGDGRSRPGEGGRFITLPTVLAEDVDWKQLTGAKGPFGMGFQEVEPLVRIENWEGGVDESTLRTVKVKWTTADGNSHEEYRLAAWAATTDGSRVRPKVLVLELERGKFRAPLVDGDFVAVSPKEMAALLAESSMFRELTVGPVRPPLILLTYDPTNFGRAANVDLIDEIRKIIGPLVTYDYSGEFTFNEESILEIPEQGEFVAGMPPRLDSVKYFSNNRVFGFPVEGSSVTASKLAGLSSRSTHGGRFAKGVPDSPLDPLVVMVDSLDGRSARLELGLPGFAGLQIEIDGAMLGEMLLQDPQVRRSLEEEPLSQVIVVAKDAGNRTNYGGLAFDLASTLRKHKLFNEVYAPDEGLGLHEESLPGAERFMRVSNWRSGDIEISPLADREGRPVALFVRYPGDGQHFQQTSEWARNIDKRFRSAAWVFVSPNLDVRRTDGIDRRIEARDLAQILRNDHYMQNLLGRQQQRIMLTSLEGRLTVSLEDFSQGMHDGGYSRHLMSPHLPPQLTEDGKVLLDPSGMKTIDPPLLKPDDLVVEPLTSDAFGTYGHAFPRDLFDRVTASQFSQKFSPVAERIYFREISMQSDSGTSVHVAPVLTPGVTKLGDGGSRKRWYLHSHGGAGGFHAAMRTDVPFRIGDTVTLAPEEAPRLIVASEAFRQARPESVATIMFLSCRLNTFGAADAPSAAALFQDSWRSITGEDASVIAGSGRVVTQPGEGVVKVIDKGVFAQALRTGEVVDPASVIHLSDLVTTEMERVDIGFMRDSSRALAVEHEPAERVRSAVRQVVRTAAWRKRIGEPLPEIGIGVLVDNRRAGLVQQDDVRNERAGKVREIIQSEVLAEAMRLGEYGLEIGPEDIEVKRIDRPLGQASTVDPTLLPVALLAKLPVSPSLQKGRDALDRLWADEDRQEHNAYQNVLTAFAALDPGHVRGTRETSIAGARAGYEHILASDNGHDVDSSLEVDHENRVSGGPEANVRARHAGRPSPRVRARLTAESNRSDSRTRLAPSKGAQRLAPAPRGRRARTPQPPVSGRSSGPSQVPIMPKPTVFAPTAGSVGGIAFGLARGHEGEWHRIHAGMPTTAADSRPLHVYVISREGKFQVGSALVGGRELASYVRALPEVRSVAAGTPVALVLMEERPRPAFAGRLDEEGRAFARALRGNSPFFPVWLSSTVAALDAAGRTELSDGGHYKVLPTVLPQDVQWRPLTDGTDIFGVVFPGMERSMGVPDWEKWVTNIALGTVAATSVSAAGERIREYSVSEWVEAIEKDRAHPLVLAFKSARGKFDVPLEKGNVWVEPKELAALIAGASWFAGLMRMPQRPHLIFLTLDLTAADPAMNAQVLGTLRELVGPLTSHDFIGAFRFGDHAVLEYPKNGKFVESPPPPLKSLNFFSEGNVFVFPVDGSAIARPDLAQLVSGGVTVEGLPESGGPPLVMIVQSPNGRFAQVEPGGPLLVLGGDQLGVTSLEDPKFKQQVMMDAGREIVVVTGGHALAKYGWLGFDFAGALRKEGIYNPVRVVTGEVTLRDGRISGSTGLVTVSNLRAGDLKTSLLHDREGNPVALFLRFPNDGKQYRNAVGWAHNITDDLREWAWVLVGPSLEVVRRDGYAQRVNITALAQVLSNDRDFERLLSVKGRKIMLANPGGRLDISMSEFSSEMVARGYSRVTARPIGDLRLLSSGNAEMRLEEVLPALPQPEDLVVEPLRNDALGHYGTAFSKTQLDRVGAALFTKNITSMTRRVYFRQSLEEYGLLHYVRRDPVLMPKVAARENVIGNVPWFFHGHGGVDGFGVSLHKDRPYRIGDNVTLHPREAANLLAATDAFRRARPERIDTLVFSSCSINRPISGGGSTAAALFGESWRSIEVEYAETVGSTEVVASYPGMGILHVTNEGVMAPAMRARESVDLLSVVRLAELAATEIVPVAVDIPPGEFTASTVGGGAAEMVRHVVRQTMRAAAWRRRIDEPLPEITIDFHVADNRTALTQSFNAQSRHVKKIVINEMIADRERLRDYGLDIDPKDIKMNFTSNIGSLPSKANPELRSVTLTVKLPDSDSVREAHFAVDRVQDIEINHDWTSHDRVLAAFAALDPEHDSAATAGGVGRPGGAG
ncbi:hypothetical protein [Amycolatopsis pretoriensis]|uniref:hypothetical protein n=1 Tax=Amycolatopsis pretoriensis TaxID=218821 RepID=UPI00115FB1C3|nr:hypothetical protein [Amycolatopsis pretoriensis]